MIDSDNQPLLTGGDGKKYTDEEQQQTIAESDSSAGFADGFSSWSDSIEAFHQAIMHGIIYVLLGVVFYSYILETKFTVIESIYFSVCIFTTVGYGDLSPDASVAGMAFTIVYSLYGIIILGIFLGILGDMAVERQQKLKNEFTKNASSRYLNAIVSNPSHVSDDDPTEDADQSFIYDILAILKRQWIGILILLVLAMPVFILEKWSLERGIYWFMITATTVGFGDEYPEHEWSKFICIFYVPLAVAFGGTFLGQVATAYVDKRNDAMEAQFLNRALNESALDKMDTNQDDAVTKDEFLVYMLKTLDKVEQDDIDSILKLFEKLDQDGSGALTRNDIECIPRQTAKLHSQKKQRKSVNKRS